MALLASGTKAIAASEYEVLTTVGFEGARLLPAAHELTATVRTGRRVGRSGSPSGGGAAQSELLEHAGTHAIPALVQCLLDFGQRGFWVLQAPLAHTSQDVVAEGIG